MAETTVKKKVAFGASAGIAAAVALIFGNIYKDEGGYVNNKNDRGGETNLGVTKKVAVASGWDGPMKAFPKQCDTEADVCADKIYYQQYIVDPGYVPFIKADPAIGEELVNTAVNMGYARENKWFQESINELCPAFPTLPNNGKLTVDGKLGSRTLTIFTVCQNKIGYKNFCVSMLDRLDSKQKAKYDGIVAANPSQKIFYRGWINNRIGNVDRKKCNVSR